MDESETEMLALSSGNGQWGFSLATPQPGQPSLAAGQSVLTVDLPDWMARSWTLNLNAPRFGRPANPALFGGAVGQPIDNTIFNYGWWRLDYGVGAGIAESVEFDVNVRGHTVQFAAASIRLYLNWAPSVTGFAGGIGLGAWSGFLTPASRGNVAADMLPSCTYTPQDPLVFGAAPPAQIVWAPRRARGYRVIPANNASTGIVMIAQQVRWDSAVISVDYAGVTFAAPTVQDRQAFAPMLPGCMGVAVTPSAASSFWVQWLLDIG